MMKKLAVPMMLLCLLCACGGKEKEPLQTPMDFRSALLGSGGCRFAAQGTAQVEDRIYEMTLDCACQTDGTAEVRVCAPESIAGVTAVTDGKTGSLRFDGLCAAFGLPCDDRLSPVSMPAVLCRAWAEGCIVSAGPEGEELLAVYDFGAKDPVQVRTWFDREGVPLRAELYWMGQLCGSLVLTDYKLNSGGSYEAAEEDLG